MNNVEPVLRPLRETDLASVLAIEQRTYPYPWTESIFRDCLRAGYYHVVMEGEGQVWGYAVMSAGAGEAHLLNLCVAPDRRRHGLGRTLLDDITRQARVSGADMLLLEVRPSNRAAITLYNAMGFNEVGVRKNYYPAPNGREDAIIFARHV